METWNKNLGHRHSHSINRRNLKKVSGRPSSALRVVRLYVLNVVFSYMDCHESSCRYSFPPGDEPYRYWWSPVLFHLVTSLGLYSLLPMPWYRCDLVFSSDNQMWAYAIAKLRWWTLRLLILTMRDQGWPLLQSISLWMYKACRSIAWFAYSHTVC